MSGSTSVRVTLALVLAVSLAGCGAVNLPFVGGDDPGDEQAEEIARDSVAEMESVAAYNFSTRMLVQFGQNRLNVTTDGTVNHTSDRLFMDTQLALNTNTSKSKDFSRVYVFGDQRCREEGDGTNAGTWNVTENASVSWNQGLSPAAQGRILNATGTHAELLDNATIHGQDVYVIRITPNHEALKQAVANESQADFSTVDIQNATITQYVAHDSNRLLRSEMDVRYYLDGRLTTMTLRMTYSDYGDVPEITPPEAAQDAGCSPN